MQIYLGCARRSMIFKKSKPDKNQVLEKMIWLLGYFLFRFRFSAIGVLNKGKSIKYLDVSIEKDFFAVVFYDLQLHFSNPRFWSPKP